MAIQATAFSGARYAEFSLGTGFCSSLMWQGPTTPHPTPTVPPRPPSAPAAISRRGAAPPAVRLVPLAVSVAEVRLAAASRLARTAVTLGGGVAWRGGSPQGRCGRSCAGAAAGDGGGDGLSDVASPGASRARGRARRIHRGVWGVRGRAPPGYPMHRREVSGIRGVSAGVEPPGDCPASLRPSRVGEFGFYRCFRQSGIPQAAYLDRKLRLTGMLGAVFWGRDLGILGTGTGAASFRWVQRHWRLLEGYSLEKNLGWTNPFGWWWIQNKSLHWNWYLRILGRCFSQV